MGLHRTSVGPFKGVCDYQQKSLARNLEALQVLSLWAVGVGISEVEAGWKEITGP